MPVPAAPKNAGPPPGAGGGLIPGISDPGPAQGIGMPGGLSPEQMQIVQIALSDPAVLGAIANAVTGGGLGEVAGPALAGGLSPQSPVPAPAAVPQPAGMPPNVTPPPIDPRMFG